MTPSDCSRSTRRLTAGALSDDVPADVLERAPRVVAQQRNDLLVDVVHLRHDDGT